MAEESITQESKMELMMQGHEIWQEKSKTEGEDVEFGVDVRPKHAPRRNSRCQETESIQLSSRWQQVGSGSHSI